MTPFPAPRRVLVTGGAGFVGYHLATALAAAGDEVTLGDDLARGRLDADLAALLARPNVRFVHGDLTEAAAWARLGTGYDEVYHLAAIVGVGRVMARPYAVLRVNAGATLRLVDWLAAGGGRRLLYASTSEVYAWTRHIAVVPVPTPEGVPLAVTEPANPRSTYAASKIFGELAVAHGCAAAGVPAVTVRFHNVYGPRMGDDHVVPQLYARARAGERPLVVYSARHRRAFCYVDDAVRACVAALRTPGAAGETINVGNDREEIAVGDLARRLLAAAGLPDAIAPAEAAHDPVDRRCPDLARARALLGYAPRVSLDEGLRLTVAWYAARYDAHHTTQLVPGPEPDRALEVVA